MPKSRCSLTLRAVPESTDTARHRLGDLVKAHFSLDEIRDFLSTRWSVRDPLSRLSSRVRVRSWPSQKIQKGIVASTFFLQ